MMIGNRKEIVNIAVFFLFITVIFLINLENTSAQAGCCFSEDNFCVDVGSETECCPDGNCAPGLFEEQSCSNTACEQNWGCCVDTCTGNTQYQACGPNGVVNEDFDCTDNSHAESASCSLGCCVYLQVDTILDCDSGDLGQGKAASQCFANPPVSTDVIFYPGLGETACQNICDFKTLPQGNIKGHILDLNRNKIINAKVEAAGITDFTDNAGYELNGLPIGDNIVIASALGFEAKEQIINVVDATTTFFNFTLTDATTGSVEGFVYNENFDNPLKNAYVYWRGGGVYADSEGYYIIENVEKGTGTEFRATKSGFNDDRKFIDVEEGAVKREDFFLSSSGSSCGNGFCEENEDESSCPADCGPGICPQNQCFVFSYQCQNGEITDLSNSCGQGYAGCCQSEVEQIPQCVNGQSTDQTIADTDVSSSSGTMCQCGNGFYDTSHPVDGKGYCCNGQFQRTPCSGALGRLSGVISNDQGDFLNQARIEVSRGNEVFVIGESFRDVNVIPVQDGFYRINLPAGSYNVTASKENYRFETSLDIEIEPNQETTLDFVLEKIPFECTGDIPAPQITLGNIKGKASVNISWEQTCLEESSFNRYELYREDTLISFFDENTLTYVDENLEWDTWYSYTVITDTFDKGFGTATESIYTGSAFCADKESSEICVDAQLEQNEELIFRAQCNENNQIQLIEDCAFSRPGLCVQSNDFTYCVDKVNCQALGTDYLEVKNGPNILGLFYADIYKIGDSDVSCLYNISSNQKQYCYYDYSSTTVDECINCNQQDRCFDYLSQDACETDNCGYGPSRNTQCQWTDTFYNELGSGICYQPDYKGTDYCNLCDNDNRIFSNVECTQDICNLLGNCYSNNGASCESCTSETTCESYTDQQSCEGGQEFNMPDACGSSYEIEFSQDSCSLNTCKWAGGRCIKDADDSDVDDCAGLFPIEREICLKSNRAPATSLTNQPSFINSEGYALNFNADAAAESQTFYCIGEFCCPALEFDQDLELPNENTPQLKDVEAEFNINFYSVDEYKNTESIKTRTIFFDTRKPGISMEYVLTNNSQISDESDLKVTATVSELSACVDLLLGPSSNAGKINNPRLDGSMTVTYTNLQDGIYAHIMSCTDLYQNTNTTINYINVDRVRKILSFSPNATTITSPVKLEVKTIDRNYCRYNDGTWKFFNPTQFNGEGTLDSDGFYKYERIVDFAGGNYDLTVECYDNSDYQTGFVDSTNLLFTVDDIAPVTKSLYQLASGDYTFIKQNDVYLNPKIKLECEDFDQGVPEEFGCDPSSVRYCLSQNTCNPSTGYIGSEFIFSGLSSGTYNLCYNSADFGGNTEIVKCDRIILSKDGPTVNITSPQNEHVTDREILPVKGTWIEPTGADIVVEWTNGNSLSDQKAFTNGNKAGTFSANIELYDGANSVTAIATNKIRPNPIVTRSDPILIFKDNVGPEIDETEILNQQEEDIQGQEFSELGTDIKFNIKAADREWSNQVEEAELNVFCTSDNCDYNKTFNMNKKDDTSFEFDLSPNRLILGTFDLQAGNYMTMFTVSDAFSNKNSIQKNFEILDTRGPEMGIIVHGQKINDEGLVVVSHGEYTVTVVSDEPIKDITLFQYEVFDPITSPDTKIDLIFMGKNEESTVWNYRMVVSNASTSFDNLVGKNTRFIIRATDNTDNLATEEDIAFGRFFEIDTSGNTMPRWPDTTDKPIINIASPLDDVYTFNDIPFEGSIKSSDNIYLAQLTFNGELTDLCGNAICDSGNEINFDFTDRGVEGNNIYTVMTQNYDSTILEIFSKSFLIDTIPPEQPEFWLDDKIVEGLTYTNNQNPKILVKFKEKVIVLESRLAQGISNAIQISQETNDDIIFVFTPEDDLADGNYNFVISASDIHGNKIQGIRIDFVVDTIAPVLTIINPGEDELFRDSEVGVEMTASEPVKLEEIKIDDDSLLNEFPTDFSDSFSKLLELDDGNKMLTVTAKDKAGNADTKTRNFVIVTRPLDISLSKPPFGVAQTQPFDVEVKTSREATCRYSINAPIPYDSMTRISDSDVVLHNIQNFPGKGTLHVSCVDPFALSENNTASFELDVDFDNPQFVNLFADPADVEDLPETTFVVLANEDTRCRYSPDLNTPFDEMQKFYNYDQGNFAKLHRQEIQTPEEKGTYFYYVQCEDKSLRRTPRERLEIHVDLGQVLRIIDHTPQYFTSSSGFLNISTNKNAFCYYSNTTDNLFQSDFGSIGKKHFASLNIQSGQETYYLRCQKEGNALEVASAQISITIDATPPILEYVNDSGPIRDSPGKTYFTDRLSVKWFAFDNESGIKEYNYGIYEDRSHSEDLLIEDGTTTSTEKTFKDLNLNDSSRYYFKVRAVNNVGLISNEKSSDGITVEADSSPNTCSDGLKNNNEKGIDCGGPCANRCPLNTACDTDSECITGYCSPSKLCKLPTCRDGFENGNETDVDCGGTCKDTCDTGDGCRKDADCDSNSCDVSRGVCVEDDSCKNRKLDPGESDTDCGGICIAKGRYCEVSQKCEYNSDCLSNYCQDGICAEATCSDGLRNKDETDVDCGGSCSECKLDHLCKRDSDCASGNCLDNKCTDSVDKDNDGLPNDWETAYNLDPDKFDTNNNGISDGDEDSDGDGLLNLDEYNFGTNPTKKDTDGDGWSDKSEIESGTDPLDPNSKPRSRLLIYLILILALILFGVGGYLGYRKFNEGKTKSSIDSFSFPPPEKPKPHEERRTETKQPLFGRPIFAKKPKSRTKTRGKILDVFSTTGGQPKISKTATAKPEIESKDWVELAPKKVKLSGVFGNIPKTSKTGRKDSQDIFTDLSRIIGKDAKVETLKGISAEIKKKDVGSKEISDIFRTVSKDEKLDLTSYSVILSSLLSSHKINKEDVKKSLNQLVGKGSLKDKDAKSIMNSLKIAPDSYVATKTGTKFHRKDCITLKKISKQNQMALKNEQEAKDKGFTKCSVCKP